MSDIPCMISLVCPVAAGQEGAVAEALVGCRCQRSSWEVIFALALIANVLRMSQHQHVRVC